MSDPLQVWQYITLMRRIYLIDCPGIVPPSARDTETQKVLKGVVRVEHLSAPGDSIPTLLERVRPEYMRRTYGIQEWRDSEDFLTQLAKKRGKLGKGGEANLDTVAKMVLNDWIRGKIPYFVRPPESDKTEREAGAEIGVEAREAAHTNGLEQDMEVRPSVGGAQSSSFARESGDRAAGFGRVAGVTQPLHQIVSRTRFLDDDRQILPDSSSDQALDPPNGNGDDDEWNGIDDEADVQAQEDARSDLARSVAEGGAEDDGTNETDETFTFDDLISRAGEVRQSSSHATVTLGSARPDKTIQVKSRSDEDGDDDDDDDERDYRRSHKSEKRMTTNKRKAENFFTHANVKNKNRNRKVPRSEGRRKR